MSPFEVLSTAMVSAMEVTGASDLSYDAPLMEAGMDSLAAIEFRD